MNDIKNIFAHNLISLRKQLKITQVEFAEKINYSDKAVSKWERGESIPDVAVLKSIGDFFGVTVDFLITEHSPDEKIEQKTNYAKSVTNKNRLLITGITFFAIFLCSIIVFVSVQSIRPDNLILNLQCCFVLPLPIQLLLIVIFSSLWAKRYLKFIAVSCFIWSVLLSVYTIVWLFTGAHYPLIFIVGIPTQIITLMSFGIINVKTIRIKHEKSDKNTD